MTTPTPPKPTPADHPDWAAVGKTVRVLQKFSHSDTYIVDEHTAVVARHTPTLIILESGRKFRNLHMVPRYLDYRTHLAPAEDDAAARLDLTQDVTP